MGQAKATNKTLVNILAKILEDFSRTWDDKISVVLWAYRATKRNPIGYTPFPLYLELKQSFQLSLPSARYKLSSAMIPQSIHVQLEALDEKRDNAKRHFEMYKKICLGPMTKW